MLRTVHVTVAGEALPGALRDRAEAAGARVSHYYGAAELSFVAWGAQRRCCGRSPASRWRSATARSGRGRRTSPRATRGDAGGALRTDGDGFATVGDRGRWDAAPVRARRVWSWPGGATTP